MKSHLTSGIIILLLLLSFSCRKDFSTIPSTGNLSFSRDTVFLDTVFTNISSSTYVLKVYNRSSDDIHIPSINLGRVNSFYRLNVDGVPGSSFENVALRGKDSLYIFIETTIDHSRATSPLYTDSIVFDSGDKLQDVKLVTLVQDAEFIYTNETSTDSIIPYFLEDKRKRAVRYLAPEELNFTNEKPYVIYGYCGVPEGSTLTIDAGAKLYFHNKSALFIDKNATLNINGTLEEKVFIEGDRLEPEFSETPGQWDAIWLHEESNQHSINHVSIRNGTVGIFCDSLTTTSPKLTLKNTEIYNSSEYALLANESEIIAENIVLGNSRIASLALTNGGTYDFNHTTFANYWSQSVRRNSTVYLSNTEGFLSDLETPKHLSATFANSIVDGSSSQELSLEKNETDTFDYFFQNCMFKFTGDSEDPLYDFTDTNLYTNPVLNVELDYRDNGLNDFQIGEDSEVINLGAISSAQKTPLDISEVDRTTAPDLGAYQHIIFEVPEEETN